MMWGNYGTMGWGWAIGALVVIIVVAAIVLLVVKSNATSTTSAARQSPKEILDERLARGELTLGQYREHLKALG